LVKITSPEVTPRMREIADNILDFGASPTPRRGYQYRNDVKSRQDDGPFSRGAVAIPDRVYFMKCEHFVKIGTSAEPELRRRGMRCGNPFKIEIIAVIHGGTAKEKEIHAAFKHNHHFGEWFFLKDDLIDYISKLENIHEDQSNDKF